VSSTYFAEGLPYMIVRYLAGVYFTDIGVKERYLGFLNLFALPWNFKFVWAPAVDIFGTKRGWLLRVEGLLVVVIALLGFGALAGPAPVPPGAAAVGGSAFALRAMLALLVAGAFLAATHDVSIDGYYMDRITDPTEQAAYTGLRVLTYRLAIIFTRSVLVAAASLLAWHWSFFGAALTLGLLWGFHSWYLPRPAAKPPAAVQLRELERLYLRSFVEWFRQPRIVLIIIFVMTYKLGDEILFSMHTPFLMRSLGLPKTDLAWMQGILGTGAGIGGSLVSAWTIKRFGLKRVIWPLTLGMNLNIWVYVWLASARPSPHTARGLAVIALILCYEQFAGGLGNAVTMIYAMRTCKPEFKAGHFAIASAITSLVGTLTGAFGGVLVERIGYVWLFVLAFVAAVPSMVALPFVPLLDEHAPRAPRARSRG
jgi:PAT family beta-lactamase induction signal transducer AmpG